MKYRVRFEIDVDSPEKGDKTLDLIGEAVHKAVNVTSVIKVEIEELEYKDVNVEDLT